MGANAGASVAESAVLGPDAAVGPSVVIEGGATVVGRVRLLEGTVIGAGAILEGSRAGEPICVGPSALVGAGSVISACDVGREAVLRPGSVVTRPVPPRAVVEGNPARVVYIKPSPETPLPASAERPSAVRERPERLIRFTFVDDMRGLLVAGESGKDVPFEVQRFFTIFGVPGPEARGEHAHLECHQLLVAVAGSLEVICDNGFSGASYLLDTPAHGLHIPPMVWGIQHRYSADAVLLVLASRPYDSADYIRDYQEFRKRARHR